MRARGPTEVDLWIDTARNVVLEARMPGFPPYADGLARGLATAHGFPVTTPAEPAPSPADAENGRKLVSANGGFSCTSCHGVADFGATAPIISAR